MSLESKVKVEMSCARPGWFLHDLIVVYRRIVRLENQFRYSWKAEICRSWVTLVVFVYDT